eukprot:31210-Pelagococcus_subviridis.AAC.7
MFLSRSRRDFCLASVLARFWKIASSCTPTAATNFSTLPKSGLPSQHRYPPKCARFCRYIVMMRSIAPSRISSVGECGKKSFPTKKHMKMKSSNRRSTSNLNGSSTAPPCDEIGLKSSARYSLKTATDRSWYGFLAIETFDFGTSPMI